MVVFDDYLTPEVARWIFGGKHQVIVNGLTSNDTKDILSMFDLVYTGHETIDWLEYVHARSYEDTLIVQLQAPPGRAGSLLASFRAKYQLMPAGSVTISGCPSVLPTPGFQPQPPLEFVEGNRKAHFFLHGSNGATVHMQLDETRKFSLNQIRQILEKYP